MFAVDARRSAGVVSPLPYPWSRDTTRQSWRMRMHRLDRCNGRGASDVDSSINSPAFQDRAAVCAACWQLRASVCSGFRRDDLSNGNMELDQVIGLIAAAFPVQPLPGISLHQAQLSDQSMRREITDREWSEVRMVDADRTWRDLTELELMACDAALAHFDEESFVYHIPAFMLFALRHCGVDWPDPAWAQVGSVIFFVTHRNPSMLARYKRFSAGQRAAVIAFLEYMADHAHDSYATDAQKALQRYWRTAEAARPLIISKK